MTFASDMQEVANDLLTEFGQQLTFGRTTQGTFVPSTGAVGAGTTTSYTAKCHPSQYKNEEIDGKSIFYDDVRLTCYTTTTPLVGDTVTLDSVVHRLMNVQRIKVQGSDIIFIAQCRI